MGFSVVGSRVDEDWRYPVERDANLERGGELWALVVSARGRGGIALEEGLGMVGHVVERSRAIDWEADDATAEVVAGAVAAANAAAFLVVVLLLLPPPLSRVSGRARRRVEFSSQRKF